MKFNKNIRDKTLIDNKTKSDRIVEFNLQDVLCIKLENPTDKDIFMVKNQLGILPNIILNKKDPDITIRFVENIETNNLTLLGLDSSGFDDTHFYLLNVGKRKAKVIIPFKDVGSEITLTCEHGLRHIPLLNHIINFRLIAKGFLPIHASAFLYNGKGVLVPGWKTGGKTEALLSFATHGAKYVSDEWVVLAPDGKNMFGIPGPTSIKDWQFQYVKNLVPHIPFKNKVIFLSIHTLDRLYKLLQNGWLQSNFFVKILGDMLPSFKRQLKIWKLPRKLFQNQFCSKPIPIDVVFLILMQSLDDISIEETNSSEIIIRMIHTFDFEQKAFWEYYNAFKFAFPNQENDFLKFVKEREFELLEKALRNKRAYKVYRPYPVSFPQLFEKMAPFCKKEFMYKKTG